ncbi:MAG: YraN family protein [Halothiobacillaceae bacterium]
MFRSAKYALKSAADRRLRGSAGERIARQWLEQQGLKTLSENWRGGRGELDLVMRDGATLVFVEVRSRRAGARVSAIESLDPRKLAKVRETAQRYLLAHPRWQTAPCRFDVVALTGPAEEPRVDWIRDAF